LVEVLLTNRRDASFDPKDVLGLNYEVPWTYFGDDTIRRAAGQLLGYRCQMEGCEKRDVAFNTLKKLEEHLWHSHWRQLCNVCLHHRPAFVCEQRAYASNDMERHFREGDAAFMSTEHPTSSAASVPAHPKCEFCGQRFFNDESLLAHMQMKHEVCNLCDSLGWKNEYYLNPKCLSRHYQECHYVCAHPDCATGGYRQIAFADEKGLEDHYVRVHKQTFVQEKGKNKLEINWFEDSNRRRGKGSGRGSNGEEVDPVHFRWPESATPEDYAGNGDAEDHARRDGNFKRYPRRDIIPLAIKGSEAGGWRAKDPEGGGGDPDSEQVEVPVQAGTAPEEASARRASKKEPEQVEQALLPAMEALGIECAVASDGPRSGAPSCLSALWGALCAILEEDDQEDRDTVLLPVVQRLNAAEVENLESMRIHLHDCPGDPGAAEHSIDWAPLERLLSLRPLLFRLLRDKTNQTKANNSSASNRRLIGPRQGPAAEQEQDEAKAWREWKVAAQAVILAMEPKAQQRVLRYVALCVQRRTALDNRDAGVPDWEDEENLQQDFPSLGEAPVQNSGAEVSSLARHARGWSEIAAGQAREVSAQVEQFPALGGAAGPTTVASWGPGQKTPAPSPAAVAGRPGDNGQQGPNAADRVRGRNLLDTGAEAFPSLGGSSVPVAENVKWGAPRDSAAAVAAGAGTESAQSVSPPSREMTLEEWAKPRKAAPAQPKDFDAGAQAEAFPTLGGGGSRSSAAPSWGSKSGAAVLNSAPSKSAAKAAAREAKQIAAAKEAAEAIAEARAAKSSTGKVVAEVAREAPPAPAGGEQFPELPKSSAPSKPQKEAPAKKVTNGKAAAKPVPKPSASSSNADDKEEELIPLHADKELLLLTKGDESEAPAKEGGQKKKKGQQGKKNVIPASEWFSG